MVTHELSKQPDDALHRTSQTTKRSAAARRVSAHAGGPGSMCKRQCNASALLCCCTRCCCRDLQAQMFQIRRHLHCLPRARQRRDASGLRQRLCGEQDPPDEDRESGAGLASSSFRVFMCMQPCCVYHTRTCSRRTTRRAKSCVANGKSVHQLPGCAP
jgi:hypothetical protein